MKRSRCLAVLAALSTLATAQAETLSPKPEPGLWQHQSTTLINGQDALLAIAGSCAGSEGYAGEMQGELTIVSRREMRSSFTGTGAMRMDSWQRPPAIPELAKNQPVAIEYNSVSTWLSKNCADLEPLP
ncbi:MAG: hypothetical protein ACJAXR_000665 [Halopseudomonas sp.]|jgi:hypothetical protein|uniref:hypothetical protein n=1 Tax=Halopseudomonas sp. TaxID=2901191 RepID=UPI0039E2EDEE